MPTVTEHDLVLGTPVEPFNTRGSGRTRTGCTLPPADSISDFSSAKSALSNDASCRFAHLEGRMV
jgi:hypothetical protein